MVCDAVFIVQKFLFILQRWVTGYRPDDFIISNHNERTLKEELKIFKTIKLVDKSSLLHDVIQQLVEHIAPSSKKQ